MSILSYYAPTDISTWPYPIGHGERSAAEGSAGDPRRSTQTFSAAGAHWPLQTTWVGTDVDPSLGGHPRAKPPACPGPYWVQGGSATLAAVVGGIQV
jgi:hypothetical protein